MTSMFYGKEILHGCGCKEIDFVSMIAGNSDFS
jgi:hypothetical protein